MSLLSALCLSLEADGEPPGEAESDDDDDGIGGMAAELLGGAGLKDLMKNLQAAQDGVTGPAGPILGGEVLGIICEREATMSGCVQFQLIRRVRGC